MTHNQTEALALADRIAIMNKGVLEQCDSPRNIYEHPRTRFVGDFIGNMNMLNGKVTEVTKDVATIELENTGTIRLAHYDKTETGKPILFCLRPERMKLSMLEPKAYENGLHATIKSKLYVGDATHYQVQLRNGTLLTVIEQNYLLQFVERVLRHWRRSVY